MVNSIVIDGGWGYGNLGDDAILEATLSLFREKYPHATITWLTYHSTQGTSRNSNSTFSRPSLHALTDIGAAEGFYLRDDKKYRFYAMVLLRLKIALTESRFWGLFARRFFDISKIYQIISEADIFVIGGGGYFNEYWKSKSESCLAELEMANQGATKTYFLGPTIGKFSGVIATRLQSALSKAQLVTVRDDFSFEQIENISGRRAHIIPDIAFSCWRPPLSGTSPSKISIIATSSDQTFLEKLAEALKKIVEFNPKLTVELLISRQWKYDLLSTLQLQKRLLECGVGANVVHPPNIDHLENELMNSALVVSENLHGLIVAARNLTPVIPINRYATGSPNYNKFVAFAKQTDAEDLVIDNRKSSGEIQSILLRALEKRGAFQSSMKTLRSSVRESYLKLI